VDYTLYVGDYSEEKLEEIRSALNSDTIKYILDILPVYIHEVTKEVVLSLRATPVDAVTGSTRLMNQP